MKAFYLLSIVIFLMSCSEGETQNAVIEIEQPTECDCLELILDTKYNRFYLTDKKKPFTGVCTSIYQNGNMKMERHYVEGKYHGDVIDYYDNGQIEMIREYKNHFINGFEKTYTKGGDLLKHSIYKQSTLMEVVENDTNETQSN